MKAIRKLLIVLLVITAVITTVVYDAFCRAPGRYKVRYETLSSLFIPASMDDRTIAYFSDLHYGPYMNADRLYEVMDTIKELSPDIILFGGDLFDEDHGEINQDTLSLIAGCFGSLKAPLGKFAVYGDTDHESPEIQQDVNNILYSSGFEVLNNTSILIHNGSSDSITLAGLDSGYLGTPDVSAAYASVSRASYVITMCHTPDTCLEAPADLTNLFLAGHSLGGQAYWGFGALYEPPGATHYFRGKHEISNSFTLDITNGVGTTKQDVRFLADNEIVLYRLKHLDVSETK